MRKKRYPTGKDCWSRKGAIDRREEWVNTRLRMGRQEQDGRVCNVRVGNGLSMQVREGVYRFGEEMEDAGKNGSDEEKGTHEDNRE